MRPTWAEISLDALRHNFRLLELAGGSATVCAVVKANAYGHGAVECARALEAAGAEWFGVTTTMEGVRLRQAGIRGRILLMTGFWRGEQEEIIGHQLTPAIWDWWQVGALEAELVKRNAAPHSFPVHLKVDTGMSRLGVPEVYARLFLNRIRSAEALALEGVFSHLASAETLDDAGADRQIAKFDEFLKLAAGQEFSPRYLHLANSAAALGRPTARRDMIRTGIALYGYPLPLEGAGSGQVDLSAFRPVLTWKTRAISVRDVAAGQPVGYNATWTRQLSSKGQVIVRGQLAPVIGRVSMDVTVVDVTDVPGVSVGDEVLLLGCESNLNVDANEHARLTGTISYEVLCRIGERVPRQYL